MDLMWPLISVEIRDDQGLMAEALLQNAHTRAVMMSNLLELKRQAGSDSRCPMNRHGQVQHWHLSALGGPGRAW